jgi:hypothetical protein
MSHIRGLRRRVQYRHPRRRLGTRSPFLDNFEFADVRSESLSGNRYLAGRLKDWCLPSEEMINSRHWMPVLATRAILIAVICTLVGVPSTLLGQDHEYLRDPAQLKKDILDSFIFRARDIFYARDSATPIDLSQQPLSLKDAQAAERVTSVLFDKLTTQYARRRSALELYFGPLPDHLDLKLDVNNSIRGAQVVPVGPSREAGHYPGLLRYSHRLLQADFRACLTSASRNLVIIAHRLSGQAVDATIPAEIPEQETIAALDSIRHDAATRNPPGSSFLGFSGVADVLDARDVLSGNWQDLMDRYGSQCILIEEATALRQMSNQYYGALMFALAHEMGHMVLRTVDPPLGSDDDWKRNAEVDADRFATFFLSEAFMSLGVRKLAFHTEWNLRTGKAKESGPGLFFLDPDYAEGCLGYGLFFSNGYDYIYGDTPLPSRYPDPEKRRLASEEIYTYVYAWFGNSIRDEVEKRNVRKRIASNLLGSVADSVLSRLLQ